MITIQYITADPNQHCDYYIEPSLSHTPTTKPIKHKYGNRAKKMLNTAIKTAKTSNKDQVKQHLINHEMTIKDIIFS